MRASTSASQACGSMSFILAVTMRLYMAAARWPPRSEPAKSHDFLPESDTAKAAFSGVVRQADAAVVEEAREGCPALEHVVHGLGDIAAARELGPLLPHPGFKLGDERRAQLLANSAALFGTPAIDGALDLEQRDRCAGRPPEPAVRSVPAPCPRPCGGHWPRYRRARRTAGAHAPSRRPPGSVPAARPASIQLIVAAVGVGL